MMQKLAEDTLESFSSRSVKSHYARCTRPRSSVNTLESEADGIAHHIDIMNHRQACIDLEKATQFITQALQHEVGRNRDLCMLIRRLEEKETEIGRSLTEQVESTRQLKMKVRDLQKCLQEKDDSLKQANKTVAFLKNELHQQLQSQQSNRRAIQEVSEWSQGGESQPKVEQTVDSQSSPLQSHQLTTAEESRIWSEPLVSSYAQSPLVSPDAPCPPASSGAEHVLVLSGIKEEDGEGYDYSQPDEADLKTEQTTSLAAEIKSEVMQGPEEQSDIAPVLFSEMGLLSSPDPQSVSQLGSITGELVDSCRTGGWQELDGENKRDGEQPETRKRSPLQCSGVRASPFMSRPKTDESKKYSCSVCGKTFPFWSLFRQHYNAHSGGRPYTCCQCGRSFTERKHLVQHQRTHTGERPYHCTQCGKSFTQVGNLRSHQRIHTGERPFRCAHCGKSFTHQGNLKKHERIHTGEKRYHCTQCGKGFTERGSLKLHRRIHT